MSRFIEEYIDYEDLNNNTWKMTEKGLECITCPKSEGNESNADLTDFTELDLRGIFDVRVERGDDFAVELNGPEREKKKYTIYRNGETLVIDFEGNKKFNWNDKFDDFVTDEVRINITMPRMTKLEATGFGSIRFAQFNTHEMEIEIQGPIKVRGELNADDLYINLSAKAEADLNGKVDKLNADLEFAANLRAYDLEAVDAVIEAKGASKARVNVSGTLEIEEGMASDVDYRGKPKVIRNN